MPKHRTQLMIAVTVVVLLGGVGALFHKTIVNVFTTETASASIDDSASQASPYVVDGDTITVNNEAFGPAGINFMKVETRDVPTTLTLTAKSGLNMDKVSHVSALFGGRITDISVGLGDTVKGPGDLGGPTKLCVIESNDLAQDKAAWLQSLIQMKIDDDALTRTKSLYAASVVSEKTLIDAESALMKDEAAQEAARQQLLVFGLTDKDIENMREEATLKLTEARGRVQSVAGGGRKSTEEIRRERMGYTLTAPRGGVIAEKFVAGGETAVPQTNLFTIADTRSLWIWADVYERDLSRIKIGQPFKVFFTSEPDRVRKAEIDWISPVLDPNTHSVKLRGLLDNSDGHILSDMYGTMVVTVDDGKNSLVVPASAVQREEENAFVFVRVERKANASVFRRTPVKVEPVDVGFGAADAASAAAGSAARNTGDADPSSGWVRIADGLHPDDVIVVSGGVGLLNEMKEQENAQQATVEDQSAVSVAQ